MDSELKAVYGDRVRVRVSGLCWRDGRLLMVNHRGLSQGDFWAPPGGGLEFGESVEERLQKEFLEETSLGITTGRFRFACEFIKKPLHAIELFFDVDIRGGMLKKGDDPEMPMIEAVKFMSSAEITRMPDEYLHGIFRVIASPEQLKTLSGFFTI